MANNQLTTNNICLEDFLIMIKMHVVDFEQIIRDDSADYRIMLAAQTDRTLISLCPYRMTQNSGGFIDIREYPNWKGKVNPVCEQCKAELFELAPGLWAHVYEKPPFHKPVVGVKEKGNGKAG